MSRIPWKNNERKELINEMLKGKSARVHEAVLSFLKNYELAEKNEYIEDKVAWALYLTWKEADKKHMYPEEPQTDCAWK